MVIIACHVYGIVAFFHRDVDNRWVIPKGGGGGNFHIWRSGRAWTSHQVWRQNLGQGPAKFTNKRKNLGSSVTIRHKRWGKIPLLGSSEIQKAKFGGKPPQPVNMKVPLGVIHDSAGPK